MLQVVSAGGASLLESSNEGSREVTAEEEISTPKRKRQKTDKEASSDLNGDVSFTSKSVQTLSDGIGNDTTNDTGVISNAASECTSNTGNESVSGLASGALVLPPHDTSNWLDVYMSSDSPTRHAILLDRFDWLWMSGSVSRPESIASLLRKELSMYNAAPPSSPGSPALEIPPGCTYPYKAQLCLVGIHSSPMMGICCESSTATAIVLNGGYADDIDRGSSFLYVGEGGETSGASQSLSRGNLGLLNACERGMPIRVIRGYKAHSRFAPPWGFRYDGLYQISHAYWDTGTQDRRVWKFIFQCAKDTQPPPLCGCTDAGPATHSLQPYLKHKKFNAVIEKHLKEHLKVQATNFKDSKRSIKVIDPDGRFVTTMRISQLLRFRSTTDQNSVVFKLPTFNSLLTALSSNSNDKTTSSSSHWFSTSFEKFKNDPKPQWAKLGFLPMMLSLSFVRPSNGILKSQVIELPINQALARAHALPYFPQSDREKIHARLMLRQPFEDSFDFFKDISQGRERIPIPVRIDHNSNTSTSPLSEKNKGDGSQEKDSLLESIPCDFTYISEPIAFSPAVAKVVSVCNGCIPKDVDRSTLIEVPSIAVNGPSGYRDPKTNQVYCKGMNKDGNTVLGDCVPNFCPCDPAHCCNRLYRKGVQFKVSVGKTSSLGWGVWAEENIPSNSFVMEYCGDLINFGEMKARVNKYEEGGHNNFCFEIFKTSDDVVEEWKFPCVDSFYFGNVARFINHSCEPNLRVATHYHDGNEGRGISFISKRDIKRGEQLFYDYGPTYTNNLRCLCGAPGCRKFIKTQDVNNQSLR